MKDYNLDRIEKKERRSKFCIKEILFWVKQIIYELRRVKNYERTRKNKTKIATQQWLIIYMGQSTHSLTHSLVPFLCHFWLIKVKIIPQIMIILLYNVWLLLLLLLLLSLLFLSLLLLLLLLLSLILLIINTIIIITCIITIINIIIIIIII